MTENYRENWKTVVSYKEQWLEERSTIRNKPLPVAYATLILHKI